MARDATEQNQIPIQELASPQQLGRPQQQSQSHLCAEFSWSAKLMKNINQNLSHPFIDSPMAKGKNKGLNI